jgi:cytochrome c peroxidase
MPSTTTLRALRGVVLAVAGLAWITACDRSPVQPVAPRSAMLSAAAAGNMAPLADPSGTIATYSTSGALDRGNPFFQSLGTNGRSCATCHIIGDGMGLSAATVQAVFASTGGNDPLFASVDGANCPTATPGSGLEAHSLLIENGLIRVSIGMPHPAEFTMSVVHDPYQCAFTMDAQSDTSVSVYRRPLPSTNLGFLSAVMFDGRETIVPLNHQATFAANLRTDLSHQVVDATLGHAQAAVAPTSAQVAAIVDFETALFTAQRSDDAAGILNAEGAQGGPQALAGQSYYPGINDPLGGNPSGAPFNPASFMIFQRWLTLTNNGKETPARQSVARGEQIFGSRPIQITNVRGLNDALGLPVVTGTCTTCHDAPNVGNHSLPLPLDIGTSHAPQYEQDPQIAAALAQLSVPDLPVYQIACAGGNLFTSDPGKALLTGKCGDVERVKGPILRGLAARAPYFHNGAAATLNQVVAFYNQRFKMGLTDQQQTDLVAFLKSL